MDIECQNDPSTKTEVNLQIGEPKLEIKFSGGRLWISNYLVTLFVNTVNLSYTTNGSINCDAIKPSCLEGYRCSGNACIECNSSCRYCDEFPNVCTQCGRNTITTANAANCQLDYVDLSQYNNVIDTLVPPPRSNRVTLGVWVFVANHEEMMKILTANLFHIVVEDFLVLSFSAGNSGIANQPGSMSVFCTIYDKIYPKVKDHVGVQSFEADLKTQELPNLHIKTTVEASEGRWFHSQCAMSLDHSEFYLSTLTNNIIQSFTKKNIPKMKFYKGTTKNTDDDYFRIIYRDGDTLKLSILNIQTANTKVYLRNLVLFQEYIPPDIHYMYHDMAIIMNNYKLFPEVIYIIPFNNFDGKHLDVKRSPFAVLSQITLTNAKEVNQLPPLNFKTLLLLSVNMKYSTIDLRLTNNLLTPTPTNGLYYNDNAPMSCADSEWLSIESTRKCNTNCDLQHITHPGISSEKGYCNYPCTSSMECPNDNMQSISTKTFCQGSTLQLYYKCVLPNTDRNIYFSSFFRHANVVLKFESLNLRSYFIEFWFFPDFLLGREAFPKADANYADRNYFFYSNAIKFYFNSQNDRYYFIGTLETEVGKDQLSLFEWNKMVLNVIFDGVTYKLQGYVNNNYEDNANFQELGSGIDSSLKRILFCHMDHANCDGIKIFWGSAFYKNLKIWDGELAHPRSSLQYDSFYGGYNLNLRLKAIMRHLPLSQQYFANNDLSDPKFGIIFADNSASWNPWHLRLWNFSSEFDMIGKGGGMKFINGFPNNTNDCPANCLRCWNTNHCYSCVSNYFLNKRACTKIDQYYFKSPESVEASVPKPAKFEIVTYSFETTITFWIKATGFNKDQADFISFGDLSLKYNKDITSADKGLILNQKLNSQKKLAQVPNFRDYFGKWIFISLAYYNNEKRLYFPSMMKFEIDSNSYPIDMNQILNINPSLSLKEVIISPDYYGLVYQIKVYPKFIVGAYGFEKNKKITIINTPKADHIYLPGANSISNCYSTLALAGKFECQPDSDARLTILCNNGLNYLDATLNCQSCPNVCVHFCYNNNQKSCTCSTDNNNSQMFMRNKNAIYCKRFDYINWAKANDQVIAVQTAKATQRFTMHFWVYAYSYVTHAFKGITFKWDHHNVMSIILNKGQYEFSCSIFVADPTTQPSHLMNIDINKWNFLSCAADFTLGKYYMNTNSDLPQSHTDNLPTFPDPKLTTDLSTTLTIQDNTNTKETSFEEWGVLFYSQIRLWSEAYFSAEFLSRIKIETPALFPYLLHAWEPTFNMDKRVDAIGPAIPPLTIQTTGTLGPNIVDEDKYSTLFLCTENGQYYDVSTEKCLQFVDLSQMKDFTFDNVPVSHIGSYSMAFWFFTEDYTTLTEGVHVQWTKHIQISIQTKLLPNAICFPQGYYADLVSNTNLGTKESTVLNTNLDVLNGPSGVWHWVLCSMSNYNKKFELNGVPKNIIMETLYDSTLTTYPYRYFMTETGEVSKLNLINIKNTMKIYFRSIQLFNDFIPYGYQFQYMDLSLLKNKEFLSLVMVVNFASYNANTKQLTYFTFEQSKTSRQVTLVPLVAGQIALSGNFIFLPLCDFTKNLGSYYDATKNLCVENEVCDRNRIKSLYCIDKDTPFCCLPANYLSIDANNKADCNPTCQGNMIRSPGSPLSQSICNSNCSVNTATCPSIGGTLSNFHGNYKCDGSSFRINYECINTNLSNKSGFYYSRCYKPPNIYHKISNGSKLKMPKGYFLEFWFKIDFMLNTCTRDSTDEYYFYSTPHSVYKDTTTNTWAYKVIGEVYSGPLSAIHNYEWNRILIKTTLGAGGQSVQVFVNHKFNIPDVTIRSIPASVGMQLQYISFCSNKRNGWCTGAGIADINWGSAYYRNLRVWDLMSSSTEVIQAYNNKQFENIVKSLVLFYPLTIQYMDTNVLQEIINKENIVYKTIFGSSRFYSADEYLLYNYDINFDWGVNNIGMTITGLDGKRIESLACDGACVRCYSGDISDCYECKSISHVLINRTCVQLTDFYLKTPAGATGTTTSISLITQRDANPSITTVTSFTLSFYIKFEGVIKESMSGSPEILKLFSGTSLDYEISTTYLLFRQNNKVAFEDQNFSKYFGKWIPIVIANYIANTYNSKYPNMLTLSVNRIDIPFKSGYTIPANGVPINSLNLGAEIVALFADLRVYNTFIQGNYGTMTSKDKDDGVILQIKLSSSSDAACLAPGEVTSGTAGIQCVIDYNEFLFKDNKCNDDSKFLDPAIASTTPPCGQCHSNCETLCFYGSSESCTCDASVGKYWLRRNRGNKTTYCEHIPYIDFSILLPFDINDAPSSKTPEATLELWMFIYSYNTNLNNFEEINIEWHLHNKIKLINVGNSLSVHCYPLFDSFNPNRYTEKIALSSTFFQWNLVRCGTDLRTKKYFLNGTPGVLGTIDMPTRTNNTTLKIYSPSTVKVSFGFVFLREIKLWQQFNEKYINTGFM